MLYLYEKVFIGINICENMHKFFRCRFNFEKEPENRGSRANKDQIKGHRSYYERNGGIKSLMV